MKLFMKLIKSTKRTKSDDEAELLKTDVAKNGSAEVDPKKRSSRNKDGRTRTGTSASEKRGAPKAGNDVKDIQTPGEKIAAQVMEAMNNGGEILDFYASPDVKIRFEDAPSMKAAIVSSEMHKLYKSFPDVKFQYESIKEIDGRILVEDIVVSGTHSGAPYALGPFPAVDTTNKYCVNDPERMWFTIKKGKVVKLEIISLGASTGLAGFYTLIGGKMEMPPQEEPACDLDASFVYH